MHGTVATIDYNDFPISILVDNSVLEWNLEDQERQLNEDGIIINIPENLDTYFSTVKQSEDRLEQIGFPSHRFQIENIPTYENKDLVVTKKIIIEIMDSAEYGKVFDKDLLAFPVQLPRNIMDTNHVKQHVKSILDSCVSSSAQPQYCDENPESLTDQILNKIGTHVVTESLILGPPMTDETDSQEGSPFVSSITRTTHDTKNNNIENLDSGYHQLIFQINDTKNNLIPHAAAQSSHGNYDYLPFQKDFSYLNGFTFEYGFGKAWSHEYNPGFPVFYVEAHVEAGLGIGLSPHRCNNKNGTNPIS